MPPSIKPVRVNHMNYVMEDYAASVAHFQSLYDADLMVEFPQKEWQACLIEIGRGIMELFVPYDFLVSVRYGPHAVGLEYQADMDAVRAAVDGHGMRIIRDIGLALHTHPADGFGIAFEFYDGSFHDREWELLGGQIRSASWWADEHPLGLTGLTGYSVAIHDIAAATAFFRSFLSAEVIGEEARPGIAARAVRLQVADGFVDLLAADGEGLLRDHLNSRGEGIRSTIFGIADSARAEAWFRDKGVVPVPGDRAGSILIPAADNRGLVFEFAC
jgi:hypothetical protein